VIPSAVPMGWRLFPAWHPLTQMDAEIPSAIRSKAEKIVGHLQRRYGMSDRKTKMPEMAIPWGYLSQAGLRLHASVLDVPWLATATVAGLFCPAVNITDGGEMRHCNSADPPEQVRWTGPLKVAFAARVTVIMPAWPRTRANLFGVGADSVKAGVNEVCAEFVVDFSTAWECALPFERSGRLEARAPIGTRSKKAMARVRAIGFKMRSFGADCKRV